MHPISRNSNILSFFSNIEITNEVVVFFPTTPGCLLDGDKYLVYFFCHHIYLLTCLDSENAFLGFLYIMELVVLACYTIFLEKEFIPTV